MDKEMMQALGLSPQEELEGQPFLRIGSGVWLYRAFWRQYESCQERTPIGVALVGSLSSGALGAVLIRGDADMHHLARAIEAERELLKEREGKHRT